MELTPWVAHYKTEFERARRQRHDSIPLDNLRCEALDRFLLLGFPTTRDEEWPFTDLTPIAETYFTMAAEPGRNALSTVSRVRPLGVDLVFVNGYYVPDLSALSGMPSGALVAPLAAILDSDADGVERYFARAAPLGRLAFVALNTAFFQDGACIVVPANAVVDTPIHVRFISTGEADMLPAMSHPRVLVVLNDGSHATVVESYTGPGNDGNDGIEYFTNAVTEIVLGEGASVDHYRLQHESTAAYHIGATHVLAARHSHCSMHALTLGGALVRNDIVTLLGGEHGTCTINGLYLADGQRLVDNHTIVDHAMPNCVSRQSYKGILGGEARGILGGRNIVRASAPKSQARQINQALVLSPDARMVAKPEVEMLASDASFTLRSAVEQLESTRELRGMGRGSPRAFTLAFARRALNRVRVPPLTSLVEELLERRLDRLLGSAPSSTP